MDRYCAYLRKSRADVEAEQRGELETLARHEKALQELSLRLGIRIEKFYREVVSGETIAARPIMQQVLAEVEQGVWAGVFVMEVERLARGDTIDQGLVAQAFKYTDTKIITPLKTYDPANEFDEEYFEFGLFMSRREYKTINRRLQRGRYASVKEGKFIGNTPPYGYKKVKLEHDKGFTLEPIPEQTETVKMIFDWYVNGVDNNQVGVTHIATKLNKLGIKAAKGGNWTSASVRDILSNPAYIGKIRWNRRPTMKKVVDGEKLIERPRIKDPEIFNALHPAIVDVEVWSQAQQITESKSISPRKPEKEMKNPLSGIVKCKLCGHNMVRKINARVPDLLICATLGCSTKASYLHEVEKALLNSIAEWLQDLKVKVAQPIETVGNKIDREPIMRQLEKELLLLEKQKNNLHDLLEQGVYDTNTFLDRSALLGEQIQKIKENMQSAREYEEAEAARHLAQINYIPAVQNLLEVYHMAETPAEKNVLLREVLDHVIYTKSIGGRYNKSNMKLYIYPKIQL